MKFKLVSIHNFGIFYSFGIIAGDMGYFANDIIHNGLTLYNFSTAISGIFAAIIIMYFWTWLFPERRKNAIM